MKIIENRIGAVLATDRHGDNGSYQVHSLYFDDVYDACAAETEAGISRRFKYRIRYYGDSPEFLLLERKKKLDGRCHKDSCVITAKEYELIMSGDLQEILWSTDKELLKQFCVHSMTRHFTPKAIVDYERTAYVEEITNIRVTFDRNISVSGETKEFLSGEYIRTPILSHDQHVLEVKFDYILPGHLKHMLASESLVQSSFSKYYLGRLRINT